MSTTAHEGGLDGGGDGADGASPTAGVQRGPQPSAVSSASASMSVEEKRSSSPSAASASTSHAGGAAPAPGDQAGQLTWQQLTDMLGALASVELGALQKATLLRSTEAEVLRRLRAGGGPPSAQSLVSLVLALAALGEHAGAEVVGALADALRPLTPALPLQERVSVMEAFGRMRHHVGCGAIDQMCTDLVERSGALPVESLVSLTWAAASLACLGVLPLLVSTLLSLPQQAAWQPKELGKLLWALAVGGLLSEELAGALGLRARAAEDGPLDAETARGLAGALLALPGLVQHLPQALLVQGLQARKEQLAQEGARKEAGEVAACLAELGLEPAEGVALVTGLIRVDVALPGSRLALSLDARTAFCANQPSLPTGHTLLRWRLLSLHGWKVVSLRLPEWEACADRPQRQQLLRALLQGPPALEELQSQLAALQAQDAAADDPQREPKPGGSGGASTSGASESLAERPAAPNGSAGDAALPRLTGLSRHLSEISERSLSRRASQEALGSAFFGVPSAVSNGSSGSEVPARLPALTQPGQGQAQPNRGAYWDQVTLASRLAAMRVVPQAPPASQAGPGDGGLPSLGAGLSPALAHSLGAPSLAGLQGDSGQGDLGGWRQQQQPQLPGAGSSAGCGSASLLASGSFRGPSGSLAGRPPGQPQPHARALWQTLAKLQPGGAADAGGARAGVSVGELKRVIELLPLEASTVDAVAPRLALLDPPQFASLLTELARDNHAFRAWQLFDWVRAQPEAHDLRRLCDAHVYTTMVALCGPWQQMQRALTLVADMRARNLEFGPQAYAALLTSAVKCGEVELATDVYRQMGQEGVACDRGLWQLMVDVFVKLGRHADALGVLDDMRRAGQPAEVQLYNLIVISCTKLNNPRAALDVFKRMAEDGVQPNAKTFTALIGSVGKLSTMEQAMDIIDELLAHERDSPSLTQTYSALMSACEKAGQWDLAVALFDKMSVQGCKLDVAIFNSMIAACAHGGEFGKARALFERMAEHGCTPDAVTYATLIRAYKKGGRWCHALDTFEAMQRAGCRPHAAVFSSIIDVLWQTGSVWAQAKALRLFNTAIENGSLASAAESCKKGTLKVDLQALTVGVAMLSMATWLKQARQALLREQAGPLDSCRKLAIVNGLGEHSRAQGHSAAVKEAVGAGLLGCKAPFRLVQDHSRSGRLEASTLALRKWLLSDAFEAYLKLLQGGPELQQQALLSTPEYLEREGAEAAKCGSLFERILKYEQMHPVSLKVLHGHAGAQLGVHRQLVNLALHYAAALQLSQETAHTALALVDRCLVAGSTAGDHLQTLLVCACLRLAAVQESTFLPSPLAIQALTNIPGLALERMESTIAATLNNDTECITAVHCLKIYLQRLAVDLGDGDAVRRAAGCAFALATQALAELPLLQYPPSLAAAAVLVAARKAQGSVPFWPSVLAQMTGYTEASTPAFASTIAHAERLCTKLCSAPDSAFLLGGVA